MESKPGQFHNVTEETEDDRNLASDKNVADLKHGKEIILILCFRGHVIFINRIAVGGTLQSV